MPVIANKILNIGINKSGTSSLTKAMRILGFRSVHFKIGEMRIYDRIVHNRANNRKLLEGMDDYDFLSDFRGHEFFRELDIQYPNSKFILTIRELDSWLKSGELHVKRNQRKPNYKGDWLEIDKEKWKKEREAVLAEIKAYFENRTRDFLIIDIPGGDGWEKLCGFLSLPVPDEPFPHENKSQ